QDFWSSSSESVFT
ncbi:unnamed protein product, partial [Allacma fusca]